VRRFLSAFLLTLSLLSAAHLPVTETESFQHDGAQAAAIFSGTVTTLSADSLTVVRRILGYPAVTRTFRLTDDTRVEGELRSNVRVTIRYRTVGDGKLAALHIIVR
jgi:hypothetical protein